MKEEELQDFQIAVKPIMYAVMKHGVWTVDGCDEVLALFSTRDQARIWRKDNGLTVRNGYKTRRVSIGSIAHEKKETQ